MDVPLDRQTYQSTIIAMHYERARLGAVSPQGRAQQGKENLGYIYTLFENDVDKDDYAFAGLFLQEYVSLVNHQDSSGYAGQSPFSSLTLNKYV